MRKKIICFFITMTFLLNLTVTTFANDTKTIFMNSLQKTITTLREQADTSVKSSKLKTILKNNIKKPKEIEFELNIKDVTDGYDDEKIDGFHAKIKLQYDLVNTKIYGGIQFKENKDDKFEKVEIFLSPTIVGMTGEDGKLHYREEENIIANSIKDDINLKDLNQLSEKIEKIIFINIGKGEFISNGNNNYTLKLSNQLITATVKEVVNEIKNDKNFISFMKNNSSGSTDAEIMELIDQKASNSGYEDLEITYDIGINNQGLITKNRIKLAHKEGYAYTIYTELAGEKYLLDKMKTKITSNYQQGEREEIIFETSGNTVLENGVTNFKGAVFQKVNSNSTDEICDFSYYLSENAKKDNFIFSFVDSYDEVNINKLTGNLDLDVDAGSISYIIENGEIKEFFGLSNLRFNMNFKMKRISSDQITLPKGAIKSDDY